MLQGTDAKAAPLPCHRRDTGQVTFWVNLEKSKGIFDSFFNGITQHAGAMRCSRNAEFSSGGLGLSVAGASCSEPSPFARRGRGRGARRNRTWLAVFRRGRARCNRSHPRRAVCVPTPLLSLSLLRAKDLPGQLQADWDGRRKYRCCCCHGDRKSPFLKGSGGWEGFGGWRKGTGKDEWRLLRETTGGKKMPGWKGERGGHKWQGPETKRKKSDHY